MHCSLWNMIYSGWSDGEDHRYPLKLFTPCQDFLSQEWEEWCIARKELALRNNLSRTEAMQDPGGICGQELIGLSTEIFPKKSSGVSPLCLRKQKDVVACANTLHSLSSYALRLCWLQELITTPKSNSCPGEEQNYQEIKDQVLCESIWHNHPMKPGTVWKTPWTKLLSTKKSSETPIWNARLVGSWDYGWGAIQDRQEQAFSQ